MNTTHNKIVAWGILASLGLSFLTAFGGLNEDLYTLAGLGFFGFGIWASVILLKNSK